jgi:hypothetical protein
MLNHDKKTRDVTCDLFAVHLRKILTANYGSIPSASKFADDFNLRAVDTKTISRETARKWMRGESIPEINRLKVLIHWLKLNPSSFLDEKISQSEFITPTGKNKQRRTVADLQSQLVIIINELDEKSLEVLFVAAWAMKEITKTPAEAGNTKISQYLR